MFVKNNCSNMILFAFLMLLCLSTAEKIICRGDEGHPVDWYGFIIIFQLNY